MNLVIVFPPDFTTGQVKEVVAMVLDHNASEKAFRKRRKRERKLAAALGREL